MRDNGPAPKRLMMSTSTDRGETWSPVVDSEFFNPGSGAEVLALRNGHWVLIYNDLERGRYSLAVSLSEDEGRTWTAIRHLERDTPSSDKPQDWGEYHYPSIIEAARRHAARQLQLFRAGRHDGARDAARGAEPEDQKHQARPFQRGVDQTR